MEAYDIKKYIYNNDKIEYVLSELGMHHIKSHDNGRYYTCGMPTGGNTKSTVVYCDNEYFNVEAYTRDIIDKYGNSDLISLVCFVKKCYFTNANKWLCDILGLNYYSDGKEELPESLKWTEMIQKMCSNSNNEEDDDELLNPISENILNYYKPYVNDIFKNEGISYYTQRLFEIGFDPETLRITIPIRDEIGTLVGIKGRLYHKEVAAWEQKYIYLERCSKSRILYGLHLTMPFIKEFNKVIVVESEKSVLKLWEYGYPYAVAIGGHKLSKTQVEKLTRLGVDEIILCYDEDAYRYIDKNGEKIKLKGKDFKNNYKKEINKFIPQQKVSIMVDIKGNILDFKESPADNKDKFDILYKDRKNIER